MIGPFVVGEQPSDPIVVQVTDADGTPRDLTSYSSVALVGNMPAGTASFGDRAAGEVQYTFDAAFASAGLYEVRIELTQADGDVDLTPIFSFVVEAESPGAIVTASEAYGITGTPVSTNKLMQAQGLISLMLGRDLADIEWRALLTDNDQRILRHAVAWQAADEDAESVSVPRGATAISTGDISLSFAGPQGESISIAPLAMFALRKLSWLQNRSMHPRPMLANEFREYTNANAFMWPVVRTDLPPYSYTWPLV